METPVSVMKNTHIDDYVLAAVKEKIYHSEHDIPGNCEAAKKDNMPLLRFREITPDTLPLINSIIQDAK